MRRSEPGHFAFYAAIALKALYVVAETIAGAGLVFVSTDAVVAFFNGLVAPELVAGAIVPDAIACTTAAKAGIRSAFWFTSGRSNATARDFLYGFTAK